MYRPLFIFLLASFSMYNCLGQYNIVDPKSAVNQAVPLPPDLASLGQYTMSPPSLSNGLPQQNIPLFEIKENGLSFPVSLFYNYSGFRVKEEASSIGLGWGMTEATIIREVKHVPDDHMQLMKKFEDYGDDYQEEMGPGSVDHQYSYTGSQVTYQGDEGVHNLTYNRMFYRYYDAQPDVYILNCAGYTAKFFWLNNQAVKIDQNDLFITAEGTPGYDLKFIVTTPDGIECTFLPMDYTEVSVGNTTKALLCNNEQQVTYTDYKYTVGWRLSSMKSVTTGQVMNFKYKPNYSIQEKTVNQVGFFTLIAPLQINNQFFTTEFQSDDSYTKSVSATYFIDEIESENFKAVFTTDTRLDNDDYRVKQIKVFNKANLITPVKTIDFTQGYFGNSSSHDGSWLKLSAVKVSGGGEDKEFNFSYVDENNAGGDKSGLSIDHWGYYNGIYNESLVPYSDEIELRIQNSSNSNIGRTAKFGNRTPNFYEARIFALEKVIYPTKGYTALTYESADGKGIRVKSQEDNDGQTSTFRYYAYTSSGVYPAIYSVTEFYSFQNCGTNVPNNVLNVPPDLPVNTISYTYTSSPDGSNDIIDDRQSFYNQVTEYIGSPDGQGGKTIYKFSQINAIGKDVILYEKDQYKSGSDIPIAWEKYNYATPLIKNIRYWTIPKMYNQLVPSGYCHADASENVVCGPADPEKGYILQEIISEPKYTLTYWKRLEETESYNQGVTIKKNFFYLEPDPITGRPARVSPIRIQETQSNSAVKNTYLYYPGDEDPDNSGEHFGIPQMWARNLTSPIIMTKTFVGSLLVSKELNHYTYDAVNDLLVKSDYEGWPAGVEAGKIKYQFGYDSKANLIDAKKENNIPQSLIWGYNELYPIADITNAAHADAAYTSFEAEDFGGWAGINPVGVQADANSVTGSKNYLLTNTTLQKTANASASYIVSYWSRNGSVNVNGTAAKQGRTVTISQETWTYYEHLVTGTNSITVSGNETIDELRMYPAHAQMKTHTYDPVLGMTSSCDANSNITYYEYDSFGRLEILRDHDYNIVKKFCYNYAGQPETCSCINNDPNWQNTTATPSCEIRNGGNTGYQQQEQKDMNICSITYNQTRIIQAESNISACPLIYAKLSYENLYGDYADVVVRFYADREATIPVSVDNLNISYEDDTYNSITSDNPKYRYTRICNGTGLTLHYSVPLVEQVWVNGDVAYVTHDYFLNYMDGYTPL